MPHIDLIVLLTLAVGFGASGWLSWRAGRAAADSPRARGRVLRHGADGHDGGALRRHPYNLALGRPSMTGAATTWSWRTYSLLLFGALLIAQGVTVLRAVPALGRGDEAGRRAALGAAARVLALVLPIIPIHAVFGYAISGLSVVAAGAVLAATRRPAAARVGDALRARGRRGELGDRRTSHTTTR
jgi:hypothetical protein